MLRILPFLFFLVGCALQPITEPRRPNPESEPTIVPTAIAIEKPTYVVERGSVSSQLFRSGRITPINQDQLSFTIDGRLSTILVNEGETVAAGAAVAMLDTAVLEQSLQAAESDLRLAQEQLTLAQESQATNLRRAEIGVEIIQLRLEHTVAEAGETPTTEQLLAIGELELQLELAQLTLNEFDSAIDPTLANRVAQSQLELERIQSQIAQSTLVASRAGTVTAVAVTAGNSVAAGETVLVIADLSRVEVQVSLLDRELQELSEGMVALATSPLRPETSFSMTIRQLPYPYGTGTQDNEADSFVRIAFDEPDQATELSIGDRIEVAILLESRDNVLWLPPAALREFNGRHFVVVQEGEGQRRVDVKLGIQSENQTEILSGVTEGQLVVGP